MAQPAFQIRSNLSRTIGYRPHLRTAYYTMLALAGLSVSLVSGLAALAYLNDSEEVALVVAVAGALVPLGFLLQARLVFKPMAFLKIHVHQAGLTLENPDRTTELPFNEVKNIEFSHLPYLGGWFTLNMNSGDRHRFNVGLERSEYILEMLASARADIVDTMKLLNYRRTAVLVDHSWARSVEHFGQYKQWLFKYLAVPLVAMIEWVACTVFVAQKAMPDTSKIFGVLLVMLAANLIMGLFFTFAAEELFLMARGNKALMKDASYLRRDLDFEKKADRFSYAVHWILALAITALFAIL